MFNKKLSYGIDFGTTNSTVAYVDGNNKVIKLPLDPESENPTVIRSVIYASPDGQFLFGKPAVDAYLASIAINKAKTKKTIFTGNYIKINDENGRNQIVPEVIDIDVFNGGRLLQSLKSALSSSSIKEINLFGKVYKIEEIVGMYLKELKNRADKIVGQNVTSVVIGRPVEYVGGDNNLAIERMEKALKIAGFEDIKFEYEPVGAAYDYGINVKIPQKILVFDFGGGTLDVSIFKFPEKEVLINAGLAIGGDHFNSEIFMSKLSKYFGSEATYGLANLKLPKYIFSSLENWYEISLLKSSTFEYHIQHFHYKCSDPKSLERLRSLVVNNLGFNMYEEIERVKKELSSNSEGQYKFNTKDINIETNIKKEEFEKITETDREDIKELIKNAIKSANLTLNDIDVVATTGGSSLVPSIQKLLEDMFGKDKIQKSDAFTGVASGLAIIANNSLNTRTHSECMEEL
jgi:hypothetical chaperone protein